MHRNTKVLVSSLAVLAAMVVIANIRRDVPPSQIVTPTPTPLPAPLIYSSADCGIRLSYPAATRVIESTDSGTIFSHPTDQRQSVILACEENIPRVPLPQEKIESITLYAPTGSSVSARLYHDASAKDGTLIDKFIFTHPTTKLDVYLAGYGEFFNNIIASIKLLP